MAKVRVYQLARELGVTNAELIEKLKALNFEVKNHMSTLSEGEVERVRSEYVQKEEVRVDEVRIKPGIIRRRRKVAERPPPAEEPEEPALPEAPEAPTEEAEEGVPAAPAARVAEPEPPAEPAVGEPESPEVARPEEPRPEVQVPAAEETPLEVPAEQKAEPEPPRAVAEEAEKVQKLPKPIQVLKKEVGEKDELEAERVGKRRRPFPGKKVVDYKVKRRRDYTEELEEDEEVEVPRMRRRAARRRPPLKPVATMPKPIKRKIRMGDSITVGELARRLSVKAAEIIRKLMENQIVANINQSIDFDTASLIASEYNYEVESTLREESEFFPEEREEPGELAPRPPVVTIMGHVNHGKTRLLDTIRKTNVMETEAGGITQHIGAYTVSVGERLIVFLDTPGHEAFTKMRARGAKVTDIVVLVVAADDGVMPQTVEAIDHARAAEVPIIVAINKVDLPNANPDRVKQALAERGLVPEEWGGETLFVNISAKEGTGIQDLLELILLQAEMLELKANPNRRAKGLIIEARLDRALGPVVTVLVQDGTLRVGDPFVTGPYHGKVRALLDDRGTRVEKAGPSIPVEVLGCSEVPEPGDSFAVVEDDRKAKMLSSLRMEKLRKVGTSPQGRMSLEDLYERIRQEEVEELNLILKADVQGSAEALAEALERLSNDQVRIRVLHSGVGGVTETDVMLASASQALIIGFNVRAEPKALSLAEQEKVDIRFYTVIYDAVSDVEAAMAGMLKPVYKETLLGHAEVRETFQMHRVGTIAGSYVVDGKMERNAKVRLLRDSVVVYDGRIASLRRFKEDVREVVAGYECGIRLENFNDIRKGDILESYALEEVSRPGSERISERRPPA